MSRVIPPVLHTVTVNGVELAYFERNRDRGGPTLLFVHCTGFHGRIWDRIIEAFPQYHTIALDQRGHGRSQKCRVDHWQVFGQDIRDLAELLGLHDVVGVGHSVGGHALVDAAASCGAFEKLILCDPTISAPENYGKPAPFLKKGEVHPAARRRRDFASAQEMYERLLGKGSYALFEPRMLWDYCEHGLLPTAQGGWTLACPPEVEASVYMASRTNIGVFDSVRAIDLPVLILRAMEPPGERKAFDFASSPTWPELVHEFPNGREIYLPDCTHFIPMQMPNRVIQSVSEAVSEGHRR